MRREEKRCEADARVRLGRLRGRSTLAARAASAKRRSHAARTRRRARWVSSMGDVEIGTRARGAFVGAWGASRGVSGSWGGAASTRVLCACARAHLIVGVSRGLALRVGHLRAFRRARGLVRHLRGGRTAGVAGRPARVPSAAMTTELAARYAGKRGPARFNARADCFGDAVDACALWFDARARSCAITFAPEPLQTLIRAALRPSARALCPLIRPRVRQVVRSHRARTNFLPACTFRNRAKTNETLALQITAAPANQRSAGENASRAAVRRVTNPRISPDTKRTVIDQSIFSNARGKKFFRTFAFHLRRDSLK